MVTSDGLMYEHFRFEQGKAFAGGNAQLVEKCFNVSGPQVLSNGSTCRDQSSPVRTG